MSTAGFCAACATEKNKWTESKACGVAKEWKILINLDLAKFEKGKSEKGSENCWPDGYYFKQNEKILCELVIKTWQVESAKEKLEASKVSQIDMWTIYALYLCPCWRSLWLFVQCAKGVFLLSGIETFHFITSIKNLLIPCRDKNRNLIISWQANCAKIFVLKPLKPIFGDSMFENHANDKYAWVGSEKVSAFAQ